MNKMLKFLLLSMASLLLVSPCFGSSDEKEVARLLASKSLLNNLLVEDKELCVQYDIYNVGSSVATDVKLVDKSFPETEFEVMHGSLSVKWSRIGPNNNVSHVVVLKPLRSGYFNFSSAEISYLPTETATEPQHGYTSSLGEGYFMKFKEYDRRFSAHILDWFAFVVMTFPSLAIPYMLWHSSKSKYESAKSKKN